MNFTWRVSGCGVMERGDWYERVRDIKNIKECIVVVTNPFSFIQLCLASAPLKSPGRENPSIRIWRAKCVPCRSTLPPSFKSIVSMHEISRNLSLSNLVYSMANNFIQMYTSTSQPPVDHHGSYDTIEFVSRHIFKKSSRKYLQHVNFSAKQQRNSFYIFESQCAKSAN